MAKDELSKTDRLLALLLVHSMQDASQGDKILMLGRAGLANGDIADLIGTTNAVVSQSLYASKAKKKKGRAKGRG